MKCLCRQLLFFSLLLSFSCAEGYPQTVEDYELYGMVKQIQKNIKRVANQRPFKFSNMNESLKKMTEAVFLMEKDHLADEDTPQKSFFDATSPLSPVTMTPSPRISQKAEVVLDLLKSAEEDYPENHIAVLLRAIVVETVYGEDHSNKVFEEFLTKSRSYSKFDERILKWEHFQHVRRSILMLLESRGIFFDGREEEIQTVIPFEDFMNFIVNPKKEDVFLNGILLALILGGGLFLIGAGFMGYPLSGPFTKNLVVLYVLVWVAYGVWMIDLAFGLPFDANRHWVVSGMLIFIAVIYTWSAALSYWQAAHPKLAEGYMLCPHCKEAIPKLTTECFSCGKRVE